MNIHYILRILSVAAFFALTPYTGQADPVIIINSAHKAVSKGVVAYVDLSEQAMFVLVNGQLRHSWMVSTGRRGYVTPTGRYKPTRMHTKWFSRKYNNAPMPHSIFFKGGYAIHGTTALSRLGQTASHGCVRLHPEHARKLFGLVRHYGMKNTRIIVQN